jgi:hypothetical protein
METMRIESPKRGPNARWKITRLTIVLKVIVPKVEEYRLAAVCPIAEKCAPV